MSSIALYARVSSEKQAQEGTIASQVSSILEYAAANKIKVDSDLIFKDDGISGTLLERPSLDLLRDKASKGLINEVLILNPDRLARKHVHQLILMEEFEKLGVKVTFINRNISPSPEDQLLLQIQGVISEYEREKILERNRRGKLHRAKEGKINVLVCAPYGYVYIKKTDSEDARYEIHQEEAKVVKRVFHWYCHDRFSIGEIARKLNHEMIPTRKRVAQWERSVVWGMLRNPTYKGEAAYHKTKTVVRIRATKLARDLGGYPKSGNSSSRHCPRDEWIIIPVPAIIDQKTFEICQERLEENKRLSPRNNKTHEYLLSGLMHCKECNYALYGVPTTSKYRQCYYRCMGQDGYRWPKGRVCSGHPVRVEALDDLVWQSVEQLIRNPRLVFDEYMKRINSKKNDSASIEVLIKKKESEIQNLDVEKERLLDLYQSGSLAKNDIQNRLTKIRSKVKKVDSERILLQNEADRKAAHLTLFDTLNDFEKKMHIKLDKLTFEEKKSIVRLLVTEVVVDTSKEEITIKHAIPTEKSYLLCPRRI